MSLYTNLPGMLVHTQYEDFMRHVFLYGTPKKDRTGTGTQSVFGYQMRFNLAEGFPLVTTKKVHFKSIILELLWFLHGMTNAKWLSDRGCTIWNEWADGNGELGPVYGKQWRDFGGVDQIAKVVNTIKKNPDSRRMVVSAWNPPELPDMALEPCHCLFQFYVADGKLSCQVYQRSADIFLGVPFNIASYAALTHMMAHQCDLSVGDLIWAGGDCHIYSNHFDQVVEQLRREVKPFPVLALMRRPAAIDGYEYEDFRLDGYYPHPPIKAPVAV